MSEALPADLVRHVVGSTGLAPTTAARVVADVMAYFDENVEDFVRRRHAELKRSERKNAEIWVILSADLRSRPFAAARLSERQLRRIVYG